MVAGHLSEKNGNYHIVLSFTDESGKRRTKWITTGLPVKGNKKHAEKMLEEKRRSFEQTIVKDPDIKNDDILFSDYMVKWLSIIKTSVAVPTYASYSQIVHSSIVPYFADRKITLRELKASDIQDFYLEKLKHVSASSVIHYHANIHKALKYAVRTDLIPTNPADKVERPRKEKFVGSFYDAEEVKKLFAASKGTILEIPIMFGAFYGLRRSEVLGLKWDAVDFERNTISIRHTITSCTIDGKDIIYASDTTKTKSSRRTLPLAPFIRERLLRLHEEQKKNKKLCGRAYNKNYLEYICVNEIGDLIKPDYVTDGFRNFLRVNGLRVIRFHDLRHSCASLMLANNVPMKQIQEWLGHSDFSTTANIYAHLEFSSKISSADSLVRGLNLGANP